MAFREAMPYDDFRGGDNNPPPEKEPIMTITDSQLAHAADLLQGEVATQDGHRGVQYYDAGARQWYFAGEDDCLLAHQQAMDCQWDYSRWCAQTDAVVLAR